VRQGARDGGARVTCWAVAYTVGLVCGVVIGAVLAIAGGREFE
jgi:uncharacterized membrane-anchored protein YhcB (DUF1043 family)